jgi:hypothetical protein
MTAGLALLPGLVAVMCGCQAPGQPTGPTATTLRIPDHDAFLDDSLSLLRRYDLQPEYVDRSNGVIVTKPTTSGQWFEWWRVDSQGGYQTLESSLHTTQRRVTVSVEPLDGGAQAAANESAAGQPAASLSPSASSAPADVASAPARYRVAVRVDKSRYSAPERQVTTASGALGIYSERLPTTEGLKTKGHSVQWVPLGRDPLLEAFLLQKLTGLCPEAAAK